MNPMSRLAVYHKVNIMIKTSDSCLGIPSSELFLQSLYLLIIRFPETIPDEFLDTFLCEFASDNRNTSEFCYRCHCWKEILLLKFGTSHFKKEIWLKILLHILDTNSPSSSSKRCNEGALKFVLALLQKVSVFESVNPLSILRFVLNSFQQHLANDNDTSRASADNADILNHVDSTFDLLFDKLSEMSGSFKYLTEWRSEKFGQAEFIDRILKLVTPSSVYSSGIYNHVKVRAAAKAILLLTSSTIIPGKIHSFHDNFQIIHNPSKFFRFFFDFEKPQLLLGEFCCSRAYADFLCDFHESFFEGVVKEDQGSNGTMREALNFEILLSHFEHQSRCNKMEACVNEPDGFNLHTLYSSSAKLPVVLRALKHSAKNSTATKTILPLLMLAFQIFELLSQDSDGGIIARMQMEFLEEMMEPSCEIYKAIHGLLTTKISKLNQGVQNVHILHCIFHFTLSVSKRNGPKLSTEQGNGIRAIFEYCKVLVTSQSCRNVQQWDEDVADDLKSFNNRILLFQTKLIALHICKEFCSFNQGIEEFRDLLSSILRQTTDRRQRNVLICFIWEIIPTFAMEQRQRRISDGLSLPLNPHNLDSDSIYFFQRILHENFSKIPERLKQTDFHPILQLIFEVSSNEKESKIYDPDQRMQIITDIKYANWILKMKPTEIFDQGAFEHYAEKIISALISNDCFVRYEAIMALPILFARWDEDDVYGNVMEALNEFSSKSRVDERERILLQVLVYLQIAGLHTLRSDSLFKLCLFHVCCLCPECPHLEPEISRTLNSLVNSRGYASSAEMLYDALPVIIFQWITNGYSIRKFPHKLFCKDISLDEFVRERAGRYLIPVNFLQDKNLQEKRSIFQDYFQTDIDISDTLKDCIIDLSLILYILPNSLGSNSQKRELVTRILQTAEALRLSTTPDHDKIVKRVDIIFNHLIDFVLNDIPISKDGDTMCFFSSDELSTILLYGFEFLAQYENGKQNDFLLGPNANCFHLSQSVQAKMPRILLLLLKFLQIFRNTRSSQRKSKVLEVFDKLLSCPVLVKQFKNNNAWVAQHCFLFLTNCLHDIDTFPKVSKIMVKILKEIDSDKLGEPLWRIVYNNVINMLLGNRDRSQSVNEDFRALLELSSRKSSPILHSLCKMMMDDSVNEDSTVFRSQDVISVLQWFSGFASLNSRQASILLLRKLTNCTNETNLSDAEKSSIFRIAHKFAESLPPSDIEDSDKEFIQYFAKFLVRFGCHQSEKLPEILNQANDRPAHRSFKNYMIFRSKPSLDPSFVAKIAEELYFGLSDTRFEVVEACIVALSQLGGFVKFKTSEEIKRALDKYRDFFVPFESKSEQISSLPGNGQQLHVSHGKGVLNPQGESHERWIVEVAQWLVQHYARDSLWKILIPMRSEFGSQLAKYVFCHENEKLDAIRTMLRTFELFWAYRNQNQKDAKEWEKIYWFDVDYKLVGDAATRCGESLESIFFLDFESKDTAKLGQRVLRKIDYDWLKENPATLISISKAYEQSGEPDDIQSLQELRMYELDEQESGPVKSWRELADAGSSRVVVDSNLADAGSSRVVVDSNLCRTMHFSGFSKISLFVTTNELSQVELEDYFEAAWRAEFWNLAENFSLDVKSSARICFHASLFMCLEIMASMGSNSLGIGKVQELTSLLDQARFLTVQRLKLSDLKVRKERERAILQLRMCDDVQLCLNGFSACKSSEEFGKVAETIVSKWESCYSSFNRNFEVCEPLISIHSVLLRIFAPFSTSLYIHQCSAAKIAYKHGNVDYAKMIMKRLRDKRPQNQAFEIHTGIWYLRDAKCKSCESSVESAVTFCLFNALRLKAKWMSDTEGFSKLSELFTEAIRLSSKLTSDHRAKIHFEYASYLERMFAMDTDSSTDRGDMDLGVAEDKKSLRRDAHMKYLKGNLQNGFSEETFLLPALDNYLQCIVQCSSGKYAHDAVFRVLHLWFENTNSEKVNSVISQQVNKIEDFSSFRVIACQLIMRLGEKDECFAKCLSDLLVSFFKQFPHDLIFELLFIASKNVAAAKQMIGKLENMKESVDFKHIFLRTKQLKEAYQELTKWSNESEISPKLKHIRWKESNSIPIPTAISTSENYELVSSFDYKCVVQGGLSKPKKIVCRSCNNLTFSQLVKGEDPNTDVIASQLFSVVNVLLKKDSACRERNLQIRKYKVIPLTSEIGLIEFVDEAKSLRDILVLERASSLHARFDPPNYNFSRSKSMLSCIQDQMKANYYKAKSDTERKEVVSNMTSELRTTFARICDNVQPVFRYHFLETSNSASDYYNKRLIYTKSVASSSMVGYIVGLGDRHLSNILMYADGHILHIDLGQVFDYARSLRLLAETVPFRLTRDMVDGMGLLGVEGSFLRCCTESLRVMRENKHAILSVIDILLHESNLERLSADRKQNKNSQGEEREGKITSFPTLVRQSIKGKLEGAYGGEILGIETQIRRLTL
eukprot:755206-Hanusia_phi.AAC.3